MGEMCYQDVFSVFGLIGSGGEQVVGILVYQSTLSREAVDRVLCQDRGLRLSEPPWREKETDPKLQTLEMVGFFLPCYFLQVWLSVTVPEGAKYVYKTALNLWTKLSDP